jgi:hypothetical protein
VDIGSRITEDGFDYYRAQSVVGGQALSTVVKMSEKHAGLLFAEAEALKHLHSVSVNPEAQKWRAYLPNLVDWFVDLNIEQLGEKSSGNVLVALGGYCSLDQVRTAFPRGVPFLNTIWIWRRLLASLAFVHDCEVVHGAVLPTHVWINPLQRDGQFSRLVLSDWEYSRIGTGDYFRPLAAIDEQYEMLYPREVLNGRPASPATDIYLAAQTYIHLLGGDSSGELPSSVPLDVQFYLQNCLSGPDARPQNAGVLQHQFDELLKKLGPPYHPRQFLEFPFQPQPKE